MNTELSAIMNEPKRMSDWAAKVRYNAELTSEDKEISAATDAWAKELGKTGYDRDHELSQLIVKAIDYDTVAIPSALMEALFDEATVGEFDDAQGTAKPKNTIQVYDSILGGNVDRSFIDFKSLTPTWTALQAETDISLADIRRGGYKTVANLIDYINEAFELKRVSVVLNQIDTALTAGSDNVISAGAAAPSDANLKALAVYLNDMRTNDDPVIFGQNKYIQTISNTAGVTTFLTDAVKNQYNTTGAVQYMAGCRLLGLSGQKKLGDGTVVIPDRRIFGTAGKIGLCVTRGETNVYQNTDIDSEKIHIKVNGYQFGTMISDIEKAAKIILTN